MLRNELVKSGAALVFLLLLASCAPNRGEVYEKSLADARRSVTSGRFDVAAERFDEAARNAKVPRDGIYARYEAALARARAGDVARASRDLKSIANTTPPNDYSASAAFKAADLAAKSDPAAGYAEYEAMMLKFPNSGDARVALVHVIRADDDKGTAEAPIVGGGPAKSLAHLDALLPRVAKTELEEHVVYERAKRLQDVGKLEAARDSFVEIANRWPYPKGHYFDDSLYRASEIEEKLGRPREAIEHLERLLKYREMSTMIGSYERPRYIPSVLRIAKIYEEKLNDRQKAREALHRLYSEFKTSTLRDDALWREAELWQKDGDKDTACDRLSTLASDFPDSRYVPCAIDRCPKIKRDSKSKAPKTCHAYLLREQQPEGDATQPTIDTARPDDPK